MSYIPCHLVARTNSIEELRTAVVKALQNNPILTSFFVTDQMKNPYFFLLNPMSRPWEMCVLENGLIQSRTDVQDAALRYPLAEYAVAPGPLLQCKIFDVVEEDSAALVINGKKRILSRDISSRSC